MKWLGYRTVAIKSIVVDAADIRRRMKEARVKELSENIAAHGSEPIQAPTVRMPGKKLLCGRDRIAALLVLGRARVDVHQVECDDTEARELELSENLYRRIDNRADLLAELVSLKEQQLRANIELTQSAGGRFGHLSQPSDQTIKAEARRQVARDTGETREGVKRAEKYAKERAAQEAESPPPPAPAEQPFPTNLNVLGVEDSSTKTICKFARPAQDAIDEADKYLRLAVAALKPIELTGLGTELRDQIQRVGELVRTRRPAALCPWCKGLPRATWVPVAGAVCPVCKCDGYVTAERVKTAPPEALRLPAVVLINGRAFPYEAVRDGDVKAAPGASAPKSGKHLSVETTDGEVVDLREVD